MFYILSGSGMEVQMAGMGTNWQGQALCQGVRSSLFFPPSTSEKKDEKERRESRAKAICGRCRVIVPCRQYALALKEPYGIWGGLNESERNLILARIAS